MVDAALAGQESAQIISRVRVIDFDGVVVLSTDPTDDVPMLHVVGGRVLHDDTATIKTTCNVTLSVDAEHEFLVPTGAGDALSPISEVMVEIYVGVLDPETGEPQLEKQATLEIVDTDITEDGDGLKIDLDLQDKHKKIERARFFVVRKIGKSTNYADAFVNILQNVIPESQINITPTTHTTPLLSWDIEDDRLVAFSEMQTSIGYVNRFDGDGNAQIHPDTDSSDDPLWSFAEGLGTEIETISGLAKALKTKRKLSDSKTYNGVIALGEPTGDDKPRIRAEAWDTNPNSLTYFDPAKPQESRYGPVPFFYSSPFITTQAQALSAAKSRLPKVAGVVERVEVTTLPNPRVRCGHVAQIERPRIGAQGKYIVESVDLPLHASDGPMVVTLRERRLFA